MITKMSSETSNVIPRKSDGALPFQMNHLPDFALEKLKEELKETPETKLRNLPRLRNMLREEPSTNGIEFHEDLLLQYLRHTKHNTGKAFDLIRNMILFGKNNPDLFQSIPDELFLTKESTKTLLVLPMRCPEGCTVILIRYDKYDPEEISIEDFKRMVLMLFVQALRCPMTQINGFKIIHDFKGFTLRHFKKCTPQNLYLLYYTAIHCFPGRYKEIHLINQSIMVKPLWAILKPFLSEKIRNRVKFHTNVEELFDYFPRSILPVEYGGYLKDNSTEDWLRKANKEHVNYSMKGQPNSL